MAKKDKKEYDIDTSEQEEKALPPIITDFSNFPRKKQKALEGLIESLGIITDAARIAGVTSRTVHNWLKGDEEFKQAYDDILDMQIDFVEGRLLQNIKKGLETSAIFYLKTKGKKRGYAQEEQQATESTTPPNITFNINGEPATE